MINPETNSLKLTFKIPFPATNIISVFSSRNHNNMSYVYGDTKNSLISRSNFLINLGIDYRDLVCAQQVHGCNIAYVPKEDKGCGALSADGAIANTDAFITDQVGLPIAIFTADCLPVFLCDLKSNAIGLVHAGWKGTKDNITTKTIKLMQERFKSKPQDLCVGFGPAMRRCCYEVSQDFNNLFPLETSVKSNHYYFDLAQANKREALELGVKEDNIFDSGACTCCDNLKFFSYRKEGPACGRMMSVMMLK